MSDKFEKLVEGLFAQEENVLGSKELEKLLFLEYRKKLKEDSSSEPAQKESERVLKLPKLQISENWGKSNTVERTELERIVNSATKGKNDVFQRLAGIQEQMNSLKTGALGKINNPQRILSQIMILETMNRLFKSFQPAPAGFINEALLSVFYGGYQTAAATANVGKDIGDVNAPDGTPISIKTKIAGKLKVDGSIENLYMSINKSKKVYFDIYEKVLEGGSEGKGGHVGKLIVSRFVIDKDNVNKFLGKDYFDIVKGKLVPKAQFKVAGKDVEKVDEAKLTNTQIYKNIAQQIINSSKTLSIEEIEPIIGNLESSQILSVIKYVEELSNNPDFSPRKKRIIKNNISRLAEIEINKRELTPISGGGLDREFKIYEQQWESFAKLNKSSRNIVLSFSDVEINNILQAAVKQLDSQIVNIFNSLDGFSQNINSYLTSMEKDRTKDAEKALQYAQKLEPQTQEVIKTINSGENEPA